MLSTGLLYDVLYTGRVEMIWAWAVKLDEPSHEVIVMTKLQSIRSWGAIVRSLHAVLLRKSDIAFSSTSSTRLFVFCTCGDRIWTRAFRSCAFALEITIPIQIATADTSL